jgi:hypothetical protein
MKKTKHVLGTMILVLTALLIVPAVSANVLSEETLTIDSDSYKWLELEAKKGGNLEIDVRIIGEGAVDIFMMNEDNFNLYTNVMDFDYYEKGSAMNIHTKKYTFEAPESQTYFFVVDNTEEGTAYTLATVKVKVVISDQGTPFLGAFEVVLALSLVFIVLTFGKRRRGQAP